MRNQIFRELSEQEYEELLKNQYSRTSNYEKGTIIFHAGEEVHELGLVLSGSVNIESLDFWGNKSILSNIQRGQIFAESYAILKKPLLIDAVAAEDSTITFINISKLLSENNKEESWYPKLLHTLLEISTNKNLALSNRIFCTSPKTIRRRVMTYLSSESITKGSTDIKIPFNREQMADYLNVERTALSKELGSMQEEGVISFRKNKFKLLEID